MASPSPRMRPTVARSRPGAAVDAVAVALGRHALALIAQDLRRRGVTRLAVPGYHCLTMTLPFQLEGFHVSHVAVGPDLMADPAALERTVLGNGARRGEPADPGRSGDPASWAILHCELFGAAPSDRLARVLADARAAGAAVVLDDTHRWPLPARVRADYTAVSARKLTGLPDGALASGGRIGHPGGPRPLPRGEVDRAETAAWLAGDHDRAEELMELQLSPVAMSPEAGRALTGLDLGPAVDARRAVGALLHDALLDRGIRPVSPRDGHFCVAFRDPGGPVHAPRLVEDLARAGVDGPLWWPRPTGWARDWPEDVVTLPIDGGEGAGARPMAAETCPEADAARVLALLDPLLR